MELQRQALLPAQNGQPTPSLALLCTGACHTCSWPHSWQWHSHHTALAEPRVSKGRRDASFSTGWSWAARSGLASCSSGFPAARSQSWSSAFSGRVHEWRGCCSTSLEMRHTPQRQWQAHHAHDACLCVVSTGHVPHVVREPVPGVSPSPGLRRTTLRAHAGHPVCVGPVRSLTVVHHLWAQLRQTHQALAVEPALRLLGRKLFCRKSNSSRRCGWVAAMELHSHGCLPLQKGQPLPASLSAVRFCTAQTAAICRYQGHTVEGASVDGSAP